MRLLLPLAIFFTVSPIARASTEVLEIKLDIDISTATNRSSQSVHTRILVPIGGTKVIGGIYSTAGNSDRVLRTETKISVTSSTTTEGYAKIAVSVMKDDDVEWGTTVATALGTPVQVILDENESVPRIVLGLLATTATTMPSRHPEPRDGVRPGFYIEDKSQTPRNGDLAAPE